MLQFASNSSLFRDGHINDCFDLVVLVVMH